MPDNCPKCSTTLDADANFCPSCSAPVSPRCPKCEKPVSLDAKFCKYCAFDFSQKASVANEAVHKLGSPDSSINTGDSSSQDWQAKANRLAKAGAITAVISALALLWGYTYTNNFANNAQATLLKMVGQTDSTYQLASLCVLFGTLGIFVGVILFCMGMMMKVSDV